MNGPLEKFDLAQLRLRTSQKWRTYPQDVLPLWVAEMDVAIAEPVIDAVRRALYIGDTGYAWGTEYQDALKEFAQKRWGWDFDIESSRLVPDVMLGIVEVLKLVTDPGASVVINSPVYPPFYDFITHMGRSVVESPLRSDGRVDLDALEDAFKKTAGKGAFLLCSPHNPTGTVHTRSELAAIAELARSHGIRVLSDEIHAPLVYEDSEFVPYLSVEGSENAFSILSASKGWNLAGIKAAVAICGPEANKDLQSMPEEVLDGVSHLGVIAQTTALSEGTTWLDELMEGLDRNRRLLHSLVREQLPGIGFELPQSTYFAWLDCSAFGWAEEPADVFLERGRVALNAGFAFGTGGQGFVRLNFATSKELLVEAVERMASTASSPLKKTSSTGFRFPLRIRDG